ncbi:hypothetical protein CVT25_014934 [Psilocybe cyanescens]|uniref:Major facilitator superfamily (MFS) profile domain-containing protein n=1 Tax=Psilocybe cyanescens TaxID=93625 RepID=A0A409XI37_PSICY|nr:hypothetical protein CVT25_014934 [Psilocybe cyanescens]
MLPRQSTTTIYPSVQSHEPPPNVKQEHEISSPNAMVFERNSITNTGTDSSASFVGIISAALTLFLATTDATIVSTSLPTIASDLQASSIQYTWVGVAYMLTQTAFQPLYGRVSDLVGRKVNNSVILLPKNLFLKQYRVYFILALLSSRSALLYVEQHRGAISDFKSINWLISARAIAGIGGGGIVSSVWVITSEVVEIRQRATWSQALSVTWSCSAIAGPLIGGLFSGESSWTFAYCSLNNTRTGQSRSSVGWRWGFYINLPICFLAVVILALSLRRVELTRASNASWRVLAKSFDFIGLVLFMGGTNCIIIGFSFATEIGWNKPSTYCLIAAGIVILVCGGYYEKHTTRDSLFPQTTFRDFTTIGILIISFSHNVAFTAGTFYLALFYQAAHGSTPLQSGLKLLPYSLGSSLASMPVAWFISYWQHRTHDTSGQNRVISIGLAISTLGFGLLNLLNENANVASQIVYPLIAGIGLGMLFHAPYQVFLRALKPQELATGTSAFFLTRFTGATVGLAVAGTIFYARVASSLPPDLKFQESSSSINYAAIKNLPPGQKEDVLHIISSAIRVSSQRFWESMHDLTKFLQYLQYQLIWSVCAPCLGVAFLISFKLRKIPSAEVAEIATNHTTSVTQSSVENPNEKV